MRVVHVIRRPPQPVIDITFLGDYTIMLRYVKPVCIPVVIPIVMCERRFTAELKMRQQKTSTVSLNSVGWLTQWRTNKLLDDKFAFSSSLEGYSLCLRQALLFRHFHACSEYVHNVETLYSTWHSLRLSRTRITTFENSLLQFPTVSVFHQS